MLTVLALLVAMMLEGAVQELRMGRGALAAARAQSAAGSALADLLNARPDSAMLARPRGALTTAVVSPPGAETTAVALQALGAGMIRATASTRIWSGGVRADAASMVFARIAQDSAGPPGSLRYYRLPGWWWVQLP